MSLERFGNFAVDWSKVYAVRVTAMNFEFGRVDKLAVLIDLPHFAVGAVAIELEGDLARRVLQYARSNAQHLTFFEVSGGMGIDMSKVVALQKISREGGPTIAFRLGDRSGTTPLDPAIADKILASLTDQPISE